MITQSDLKGIDASWLAVDAVGQVALFITAGESPVPRSALQSVETAEEAVLELPRTSDFHLYANVARPDDFVAPAVRGFFVYDWSDVHRTLRAELGGYELQAKPTRPLLLTQLPPSIQAIAAKTLLLGVEFGQHLVVLTEEPGT